MNISFNPLYHLQETTCPVTIMGTKDHNIRNISITVELIKGKEELSRTTRWGPINTHIPERQTASIELTEKTQTCMMTIIKEIMKRMKIMRNHFTERQRVSDWIGKDYSDSKERVRSTVLELQGRDRGLVD